jgi:hypothetical protein
MHAVRAWVKQYIQITGSGLREGGGWGVAATLRKEIEV